MTCNIMYKRFILDLVWNVRFAALLSVGCFFSSEERDFFLLHSAFFSLKRLQ